MKTILVTRPRPQGEALCSFLRNAGFQTLYFPVVEIEACHYSKDQAYQDIQKAKLIVFVSANAVHFSKVFLEKINTQKIAAIGNATAKAIKAEGLSVDIVPREFNSEGLLNELKAQGVARQKTLIIRGQEGREFLADELKGLGADVEYLDVYKRVKLKASLSSSELASVDIIVATSEEILRHLAGLMPRLLSKKLLVSSERLVNIARELGFIQKPLLAKSATQEALLEALR
jgi:uroporphyrinogen-III synthase